MDREAVEMELALTVVSGIAWTVVYLDCIRVGFRDHTFPMPLFALGLNIAWEVMYGYKVITHVVNAQAVIIVIWAALDAVIVVTYFRYGRRYWPSHLPRWGFIPWGASAIVLGFVLQQLFVVEFGDQQAVRYAAFLQNLLMSVLFLAMFASRPGGEGQSTTIAVGKLVGTMAATVIYGVLEASVFILTVGVACAALDAAYVWCLRDLRHGENPRPRRGESTRGRSPHGGYRSAA